MAYRIVSHVLKRVLPPIVKLDQQRLNVMKVLDLPLLVLRSTLDDDKSFNILNSLAERELSDRFFVAMMTDSPFIDVAEMTSPFVTVFNILDETIPTYNGPLERTTLLGFANKVSSPLIRQFDLSSLVSFMKVNGL